jgi:hypothetical protein
MSAASEVIKNKNTEIKNGTFKGAIFKEDE